LDKLNL